MTVQQCQSTATNDVHASSVGCPSKQPLLSPLLPMTPLPLLPPWSQRNFGQPAVLQEPLVWVRFLHSVHVHGISARAGTSEGIRQKLNNQKCHGWIRRRGSARGWMIKPFLAQGCGAARLRKGKRGGAMAHLSVERYRVASSLNVGITRRAPGPCIHSISQEMADSWLRNLTKL